MFPIISGHHFLLNKIILLLQCITSALLNYHKTNLTWEGGRGFSRRFNDGFILLKKNCRLPWAYKKLGNYEAPHSCTQPKKDNYCHTLTFIQNSSQHHVMYKIRFCCFYTCFLFTTIIALYLAKKFRGPWPGVICQYGPLFFLSVRWSEMKIPFRNRIQLLYIYFAFIGNMWDSFHKSLLK